MCTCVYCEVLVKHLPSFVNDCAAATLTGLGGTLKVAFVRKARLTLFHFESCLCIFGAGVIASSIVEYWNRMSYFTYIWFQNSSNTSLSMQFRAQPMVQLGSLSLRNFFGNEFSH